jgi:uncharacterized membrane protein YqaE (UPF0057 family)
MSISTHNLIWLFPVAFIVHDFEELVFLESWLKNDPWLKSDRSRKNDEHHKTNGDDIRRRIPAFLAAHLDALARIPIGAFATAVCMVFLLAAFSSFLAVEHQSYAFFLLASGMFFVHAFGHLLQSFLLRKYVPGVITALLVVIPYGLIMFGRLMGEGTVSGSGLIGCCAVGAILFLPFVVVMLKVGEIVYATSVRLLVSLISG